MTYGEAWDLVQVLLRDPSSWLAASIQGWSRPVSDEWLALRALHDRWAMTAFEKPYPTLDTPWGDRRAHGEGAGLDVARFRELVEAHRRAG